MKFRFQCIVKILIALFLLGTFTSSFAENVLDTMIIEDQLFKDTTVVSPTSTITAEDLEKVNIITTEDAIALEPSLIVRRRFIGDPNGVIGIRGSNMFQGHRSLIFVDGLPLHYHLQTRFSGAPRWSLVAPNEIDNVDVIYGPFSAEYSGNSMGGVVNIRTKRPVGRKFTIQGNLFSQDFSELGTSDDFNGGKVFASYEDKFGDLSVFASYNHLENESQPQTFFFSEPGGGVGVAVNGAINGIDESENVGIYFGDNGEEQAQSDLYKLKLGYDIGLFQLRSSIAYENRDRELKDLNSYLTDATGNTIWDGDINVNGIDYNVRGSNFQERDQQRESVLFGLGLSGPVGVKDWLFDIYYTDFEIIKDREIRSARNPDDPDFIAQNAAFNGRLTNADDTGWETFDVKAGTESLFGNDRARLSIGYHYDEYELSIEPYNYDAVNGIRGTERTASGGETSTQALFAQFGYALSDQFDLALGLRYEDWETKNGFNGTTRVDRRDEQEFSPKFSLGYFPANDLTFRYSLARAVRFPIVEELYRNESTGDRQFVSDPNLEPEDGIHHNFSVEKDIDKGSMKVNLFYEEVEDVIFTFSAVDLDNNSITTTLPVDEVETYGAEFVYNQRRILGSPFDMRFNVSYTEAEITKNRLNPSIEGGQFPRIPDWRSNLLLTYNYSHALDFSTSVRYASNSYGELDNSDRASNVFGAQDEFLFFNIKTNWKASENLRLAMGVDNLFNEEAYVFHPWPNRTFFLEGTYTFGEEI